MEPDSSISSSKSMPSTKHSHWMSARGLVWLAVVCVLVGWVVYLLANPLGNLMSEMIGDYLVKAFKGRVNSPENFFAGRFRDLGWLCVMSAVTAVFALTASRQFAMLKNHLCRVLLTGVVCFISMNFLFGLSMQTVTFWLALFVSSPTFKDTSFNMERLLLSESNATRRIAILGSSQAASEIDSGLLSQRMFPSASFSMMHFAGGQASDLLVFLPYVQAANATDVLCYVSPQTLYPPTSGHTYLPLLQPGSLAALLECGLREQDVWQNVRYGLVSIGLPSFRVRRGFSTAILGPVEEDGVLRTLSKLKRDVEMENAASASSGTGIETQTDEAANLARFIAEYRVTHHSDFQKACFQRFLQDCRESGIGVHIVVGQVHPKMQEALPQSLHQDFESFLNELAASGEVDLMRSGLPIHQEQDYSDWMHVKKSSRKVFTEALLPMLQARLQSR